MERLSSCYFCGTALDGSLDEYPVVPDRFRPASGDVEKTVVLCDACARKLDGLMDVVVDAAAARGAGGPGEPTGTAAGDAAHAADAGSVDDDAGGVADDPTDIESTLGDDEELLRPLGDDDDDEMDPAEAAEASGMQFGDDRASDDEDDSDDSDDSDDGDDGDDGNGKKYTSSRGAGFRRENDEKPRRSSLRNSDEDAKYTDSRGAGYRRSDDRSSRTNAGGGSGSSSGSGSGSSSGSGSESGSGSGPGSGSSGGAAGDAGGDDSASTDGDDGDEEDIPDVSMTRLENTKVMRLLENREFPVNKEEFVTVAASAYQISQRDCEKVLDLAVEHGLIEERDGKLYGGEL